MCTTVRALRCSYGKAASHTARQPVPSTHSLIPAPSGPRRRWAAPRCCSRAAQLPQRQWHDKLPNDQVRYYITLYRPDFTITFVVSPERDGYVGVSRDHHSLGEVLISGADREPAAAVGTAGPGRGGRRDPAVDAACKK